MVLLTMEFPSFSVFRFGYSYLFSIFPEEPGFYLACMPLIVSLLCEIMVNGFFTFLDLQQFPVLDKFRIDYCQSALGVRHYPPKDEIIHAIKIFLGSYVRIIVPIHCFTIAGAYLGYIPTPKNYKPEDITDINILADLFICVLFADVWNYTFHRLMHVPYFFNRFHRLHHEYTYTFVWVNHAFHDIEVIIFGTSVVLPPLLLRSHVLVTWLYTGFTIFHTGYQHSGYVFPFLDSSLFHDAHHYLINKNFASHLPFMDILFGTYARNNQDDRDNYQSKKPSRVVYPQLKSFMVGRTALSK